jgi:hypothetical protein
MTTAGRGAPGTHRTTDGFFAGPLRDYALHCLGGPVSLLQAGCLAPLAELGIGDCAGLLERVQHVELVLDRLVSALKPGGLLLIRTMDRYSAAALLDRLLPGPARKALWSRFRPEVPGPFPAVYDKPVCDAGIASCTLMRGLVIAARGAGLTLPSHPAGLSSSVRVTCAAISRLTRGRFGDSHDELLYVIRKPQDRFARVV